MTPSLRSAIERALPLLLFAGCLALYLAGAARLADTPIFDRDNVFFRSDTRRVFNDLTGPRHSDHRRTSTHPIFVLAHHPIGRGLMHALDAAGVSRRHAREASALLLTATAGALAAALAFRWLQALGVSLARAGLLAAILGASTAHWIFASIPETWIFSALALAATACVASRPGAPEWRFQLAAGYAIGVLTTNLVPVAVLAVLRHAQREFRSLPDLLVRAARSTAAPLAFVIGLALVQHWIYPTTTLFFLRDTLGKEQRWVDWTRWTEQPATTLKVLVRHFAIDAVVAPAPESQLHDGFPMASIEHVSRGQYRSRGVALALWATLLAVTSRGVLRRDFYRPPIFAALAILAFNFVFHSFFGNDRLLYACDWTLFVIAVVAVAVERAAPPRSRLGAAATALLALFLAVEVWFNWRFLGEAAAVVSG